MQYFSEIYSRYYRAVAAVLRQAKDSPVSIAEINSIIAQTAFSESGLYIAPNLTDGTWPLLIEQDGMYTSAVDSLPEPMTALQRAWLCTVLDDERCSAFLSSEERGDIKDALSAPPLYDNSFIRSVDVCSDPDRYDSDEYAARFRQLLCAIKERRTLHIKYTGGKGIEINGDFLPCRLEYSPKDDKFRLLAVRIRYGKAIFCTTVNLARINRISASDEIFTEPLAYDQFSKSSLATDPVTVEINDERNALERFMVHFSNCDKRTRYDEETDRYICELNYRKDDEAEILIRLLSYGPVVRVLSPDSFVAKMRERIMRQAQLLE